MDPVPFAGALMSPPGRYGGGSPFVNPVCGHWSCPLTVSHHHCRECGYGGEEVEQLKLHSCRRPYVSELAPPPPPGAFFRPPAPTGYYRTGPGEDREYSQLAPRPLFPPAPMMPGQYFPPPPPVAPLYRPPLPAPPRVPPPDLHTVADVAAPLDFSSDRRAATPPGPGLPYPSVILAPPGPGPGITAAGTDPGASYTGAGYWSLPAPLEPDRDVRFEGREERSLGERGLERLSCQVQARQATERQQLQQRETQQHQFQPDKQQREQHYQQQHHGEEHQRHQQLEVHHHQDHHHYHQKHDQNQYTESRHSGAGAVHIEDSPAQYRSVQAPLEVPAEQTHVESASIQAAKPSSLPPATTAMSVQDPVTPAQAPVHASLTPVAETPAAAPDQETPAPAERQEQEPAVVDVERSNEQSIAPPSPAPENATGSARASIDSDTSLSPINVDIEVHCLICSTRINLQCDQYCDVYLDNIVTAHSKLPVSEKLGRVLRYHFSPELLYSHTLCRRCFNIINGIDQLEGRLDKLRSEVRNKFSITCRDRGLHPHHFPARPDSAQPVESRAGDTAEPTEPAEPQVQEPRAPCATAGETMEQVSARDCSVDGRAEEGLRSTREGGESVFKGSGEGVVKESANEIGLTKGAAKDVATDLATEKGAETRETANATIANTASETCQLASLHKLSARREFGTQTCPPALPWQCRHCGRVFRYRSALRRHAMVHKTRQGVNRSVSSHQLARLRCIGCRGEFESRAAFLAHVCPVATKAARPRCAGCGKEFRQRRNMLAHLRLCKEVERFECKECGRKIRGKDAFARHCRSHHLRCAVCDKSFSKPSDLKRHQLTHAKVKSHVCETCGKQFSTTSNYNQHVSKVHQATKVFKCSECPKSFSYRSSLQLHMKRHGGQKAFTCEQCGKEFLYKNNLARHLKVHASVRQEMKCNKCNEVFSNKSSLKAHALTCF